MVSLIINGFRFDKTWQQISFMKQLPSMIYCDIFSFFLFYFVSLKKFLILENFLMKFYNSLMQKLANYDHELRVVSKYSGKRKRRMLCDMPQFKDISVSWILLGTQSPICFYIIYDDSCTPKQTMWPQSPEYLPCGPLQKKSLQALN